MQRTREEHLLLLERSRLCVSLQMADLAGRSQDLIPFWVLLPWHNFRIARSVANLAPEGGRMESSFHLDLVLIEPAQFPPQRPPLSGKLRNDFFLGDHAKAAIDDQVKSGHREKV